MDEQRKNDKNIGTVAGYAASAALLLGLLYSPSQAKAESAFQKDSKGVYTTIAPGDNLENLIRGLNEGSALSGKEIKELADTISRVSPDIESPRSIHPGNKAYFPPDVLDRLDLDGNEEYANLLIRKGHNLPQIVNELNNKNPGREELTAERIAWINGLDSSYSLEYGNTLKVPAEYVEKPAKPFEKMDRDEKIDYLKDRTIEAGWEYLGEIVDASEKYDVDARLSCSIIWTESTFDPSAISSKHCKGLVQLNPLFHGIHTESSNIETAIKFFKEDLYDRFIDKGYSEDQAARLAIASYKDGFSGTLKYLRKGWQGKDTTHPNPSTYNYISKIEEKAKDHYGMKGLSVTDPS